MSESMQSSREQEQRRFDEFLSAKGLKPYDRMEKPDDLCNRKMIEQYKDYLAEDYRQQNGKHYSPGTAMIFLNQRMQAAANHDPRSRPSRAREICVPPPVRMQPGTASWRGSSTGSWGSCAVTAVL